MDSVALRIRSGAIPSVDIRPVEARLLSIRPSGHQQVPGSGLCVIDGENLARPHQDELALLGRRAVRPEGGGPLEEVREALEVGWDVVRRAAPAFENRIQDERGG